MQLRDVDPSEFTDPEPTRRSSEHWILLGVAVFGLLALLLIGFFLPPDARGYGTHEQLGLQPCYPMEVWNFPCPGCGVTTSVARAARGDFMGSLATQPFGLLLALVDAVFIVWAFAGHVRGRDLWVDLNTRDWFRWISTTLSIMAIAWIYKIALVRHWI